MAKRPDPVLDPPDPIWIKSYGSYRIRIHNNGSINILFLFFRYVRMHNYPFHNFTFLPTLSTSLGKPVILPPEDGGSQHPDTARFTVSYFTVLFSIYCTIFYLSFLFYDASFSVVIFRNHCCSLLETL